LSNPALSRLVREAHLYMGVLFAPTIIFFALTGALQLFGLHEDSRDGSYTPVPVIERLGQVHIHQRFADKPGRPDAPRPPQAAAPAPEAAPAAPDEPRAAPPKQHPGAKWFFLATALGLTVTALLGVWMGLTHLRQRNLAWGLLGLGILAPVLLLII
jgi:hypothetical protein